MPSSALAPALVFALCLLALFLLPIVLGFLAGMWEKRLVWPYVTEANYEPKFDPSNPYQAPGSGEQVGISEYAMAMGLQARTHGFRPLGEFFDGKGKIYRLRYEFWLAHDQMVVANIGSGTLAGIPLQTTWLFTRLGNGHCLVTLDEPKGVDSDTTGMTEQVVLANADFPELLAHHRRRIDAADPPAVPYSASDPLADHLAFRAARAERLVDQGLAKYLDEEHRWYKYTVRGAFVAAVRTATREWVRAIRHRGRQRIARPGQRGYVSSARGEPASRKWIERLRFVCWMCVFMGAVLSFSGNRPVNQAQFVFRTLVPLVGLVGLLGLWLLKLVLKSSPSARNE